MPINEKNVFVLEGKIRNFKYFLGVDFARMGQDSSVFTIVEVPNDGGVGDVIYIEETNHTRLTDSVGRVKFLHGIFRFERIYLDSTGLGSGPTDSLTEAGLPIEAVTFTIQSKQDIFSNLKKLMEEKKIRIPRLKKLVYQLLDLRYEFKSSGNMSIHHSERGHDDFCDSLALACLGLKGSANYEIPMGVMIK